MELSPERMPTEFVPITDTSIWTTAIQLAGDVEPAEILNRLVKRLLCLCSATGTRITLAVEPTGDACHSGHWVNVNCEHGLVWADLTPWPARHNGVIPIEIDALLDLAGWLLISAGSEDDFEQYFADPNNLGDLLSESLPARRLVAVSSEDDLAVWAEQICAAIHLAIEPENNQWFMTAEARIIDEPNVASEYHDYIASDVIASVDLGSLLKSSEWKRAIWPSGSEEASLCCLAGYHSYHEPPCEPDQDSRAEIRNGKD